MALENLTQRAQCSTRRRDSASAIIERVHHRFNLLARLVVLRNVVNCRELIEHFNALDPHCHFASVRRRPSNRHFFRPVCHNTPQREAGSRAVSMSRVEEQV
jgi:hypothetical protein